ncbi:hypothetical protein [Neptuniibacter halophilus]|uniref:hypothetical protein n=1 Tax=Neptuniibacter halophilus TaxID=651666 RepID=UPI0025729E01|nr:hypothetical protein [Neptuniibacter halophilus]
MNQLGNKTGNCSKDHLLDCLAVHLQRQWSKNCRSIDLLAKHMLTNWTLDQRREYLAGLPDTARGDLQKRLLDAHKALKAA